MEKMKFQSWCGWSNEQRRKRRGGGGREREEKNRKLQTRDQKDAIILFPISCCFLTRNEMRLFFSYFHQDSFHSLHG